MEELEARDPKTTANQLERPEVRELASKWIRSLKAYSLVYKNLEHIPDELKREHLSVILLGWSTIITYLCTTLEVILSDREFSLGNSRYSVDIPDETRVKFLRALLVSLPDFVSEEMRADLGSSKLELQLRSDNIVTEVGAFFLQKGLAADLRIPEYHGEIDRLRKYLGRSRFFLEALLVKLRSTYLRFGREATDDLPLQRTVAEIRADLMGKRGQERQRFMEESIQELRQRRLVDDLRQKSI